MSRRLIVIAGPTAVGKSAVAIEVAKRISGEIVSADSMQVYVGMDIGTAKVTPGETQGIPHHMLDVVEPDVDYSVSLYQREALRCVEDILARGKTPILCGGSGLYVNSIIYDLDFATSPDDSARRILARECDQRGLAHMYDRLKALSPNDALRIHPNDRKRILRRLEVLQSEGGGEYDFQKKSDRFDCVAVGLTMPRERLYERINRRVDMMVEAGLINEVKGLRSRYKGGTALAAIGYKEVMEYLDGRVSLDEAVNAIKQGSRRLAKRQLTWFKRDERIKWFNIENYPCLNELVNDIIMYINSI